ncbi:MAG TPA: long-chain fatty acid--CoA ligase [Candidatus Xenobia bacterium]|nr:long-chain fatty acid--CoA ligase [Candidatus Xenobia bacterium]
MAERPTLNQILLDSLRRYSRPDLLYYKRGGEWRTISTDLFLRRVSSLADSLKKLGIQKGDRVAVFSENRPEWHIADLAILGLGAVNVPIYPAESVERAGYILEHSEAKVCFVSGIEQFGKISQLWHKLPALQHVIPFDSLAGGDVARAWKVLAWGGAVRDDAPPDILREYERVARSHQPDDIATLIYTSGTTGVPKGVLLTQHNFASNVVSALEKLAYQSIDRALCLLPLCHIFERTNSYCYFYNSASIVYAENFDKVVENMREMQPTVMAGVPRFFEKLYAGIQKRRSELSGPRAKIFDWAVAVGREATPYRLAAQPLPSGLRLRYWLAEKLVYRKVRAEIGGRFRHFISGSAPLARGINEFLHAVGFSIFEGYGLTETSPVVSVNTPGAAKLGTVGRPIRGVEVKIAEDGEVLVRGPNVMKGYYRMEEETREALRDGWFHTGDVGFLDADGFLSITDRKKDLIKTAGGKFIAPQPIENQLKQSYYISSAVVLGDRQRFVVALLVPNFPHLEEFAREKGINAGSRAKLVAQPAVRALYDAEVEKVNGHLAQYERIKRYALLDHEFSFDGGQLTYTQKVRRRMIEKQHRELLAKLYAEESPQPA